jgi:hypothetical protein
MMNTKSQKHISREYVLQSGAYLPTLLNTFLHQREENMLNVFENLVPRRISEPKRQNNRELENFTKGLHNFYSPKNIIEIGLEILVCWLRNVLSTGI